MKSMKKIPFNKPAYIKKSEFYIEQALRSDHLSGDGFFTKESSVLLEKLIGTKKALLTTSCTHALEMAAILLDIKPGDEVIVPSFTFVSTVNAVVLRGGKPVFIDIRPDTLNLDERQLEQLITPKTKAIFVVHYAGVACEMDSIIRISEKYGIPVVEDNAHGLFGKYKDKNLGTIGVLATQSFHETKNISTGEGGALFINDPSLIERAEIVREKGTNRNKFFRGQVDKYTWVDIGSSYLPSEVVAALLLAQLEAADEIQNRRNYIWNAYQSQLSEWTTEHSISTPHIPSDCCHPAHLYYLLMPDFASRTRFIEWMKSQNITCVFHYLPLHLSPMGRKYGGKEGDCPVTESVSDRLVRLPLFYELSDSELSRIINAIKSFTP
ncbi:MAG: dTDP-4-amino-4,6-dideoxygalactose transaminase [Anaerolineaceae bacterium]|jgi:dTDP-4-amino-4,6-dideoxygalactose transaminase